MLTRDHRTKRTSLWVLHRLVQYLRISFHTHEFVVSLKRLENLVVLHRVKGLLLPLLLHTAGFWQYGVALVNKVWLRLVSSVIGLRMWIRI